MTAFGGFGKPGQGAAVFTSEREFIWGGDDAKGRVWTQSGIVSGATRDAGDSPTTVLRSGLLLAKLDSSLEFEDWDADAADGTQYIRGILWKELRATDFDGNNTDRSFSIVVRAPLIAEAILIEGVSLVGHTHEYLARRQLVANGCIFDDDPFGYKAGADRFATVTGTSDTLTGDENGTTLFYSNAASVTVTLPAIKPGLVYDLVRTGDEEFIVASAEGNNMVVGNDLSATSVTFTTATNQIGARVRVRSVYVSTTLKWLVELPTPPFSTGFTNGFAYSISTT